MKSLEKLKKVLSDVEINEEQKSALDEFFAELYENLQEKAREEVQEELEFMNEALDGKGSKDGWIRVEEAEEAFNRGILDAERAFNALSKEYDIAMEKAENAFNLLSNEYDIAMENAEKTLAVAMENAEKAFNLFAEDSEKAFNLAMEDSEKAFTLVQEDLIKEHSETMSRAMDHLYETLLEKAKEEIYESDDFSVIRKIKEILAPVILEESNEVTLMSKIRELEKKLSLVNEEKINNEKDQIIESLVDELPIKEAKIVRNYISEANSIQEVYERYNLAISLLEAKEERDPELDSEDEDLIETKSLKEENTLSRKPSRNFKDFFEAKNEDEEDDFEEDELEDETSEFEFQTEEAVFTSNSKEKPKTDKFNSFEEAIISSVFKK